MHPIDIQLDISGMWRQQYTAGAGNIGHVAVKRLRIIYLDVFADCYKLHFEVMD